MNKLHCFTFIVLALVVQQYECGSTLNPQIKVVGFQTNYLNPEYSPVLVNTLSKLNNTFNNVNVYWKVIQDLPADVSLFVKVIVTDSTYQGGKEVLDVATPICKESKNRQLLTNVLVVPENKLNTQCLRKGILKTDSLHQFRFEVLLPGLEKLGSYYRSEYVLGTKSLTILNVTFYNQWGYLNKN